MSLVINVGGTPDAQYQKVVTLEIVMVGVAEQVLYGIVISGGQ